MYVTKEKIRYSECYKKVLHVSPKYFDKLKLKPGPTQLATLEPPGRNLVLKRDAWSCRHGESVGGLIQPKQSSKPPDLKYETLYVSGTFVKFECQAPPARM